MLVLFYIIIRLDDYQPMKIMNMKSKTRSEMTAMERKEKKYGLDFRKLYIEDAVKWGNKSAFDRQKMD